MADAWERRSLIVLVSLLAAMALGGGAGLIVNGLGMPGWYLASSPFGSYVWPGIILFTALGVTNAAAAYMLIRRNIFGLGFAALGGLAALGWIVGELYTTPVIHWMQLLVAILGGLQVGLVLLLLGILNPERRVSWTR